jgi:nuclear pore complex protein Nup155
LLIQDPRAALYEKRVRCYAIIFEVLEDLDLLENENDSNPAIKRLRTQTYELVYGSDDELFHQALYDWYVSRGQQDRLLEVCPRT